MTKTIILAVLTILAGCARPTDSVELKRNINVNQTPPTIVVNPTPIVIAPPEVLPPTLDHAQLINPCNGYNTFAPIMLLNGQYYTYVSSRDLWAFHLGMNYSDETALVILTPDQKYVQKGNNEYCTYHVDSSTNLIVTDELYTW